MARLQILHLPDTDTARGRFALVLDELTEAEAARLQTEPTKRIRDLVGAEGVLAFPFPVEVV
ncbi:hypothetical protein [Streptomyces sp. NPDC127105]|uniref:hypothetical protein n=1 Tax=Streptomyces sp. NPDC127105 TaxID=3345359 RepID=UPI00366641DB